MKTYSLILLFILNLFTEVMCQNDPTQDGKIILVVETFRHGARYRVYPNTYQDDTPYQNYGELTGVGERMHYVLGQSLRQKYSNTNIQFPDTYDPNFIWVRSTDLNRTIMSAYSQLAGMFQLGYGQDVSTIDNEYLIPPFKDLNMNEITLDKYALLKGQQVFPIHVTEDSLDYQLLGYSPALCFYQMKWMNENFESDDWKRINLEFENVVSQLLQMNEMNLQQNSSTIQISQLVDTLLAIRWQDNQEQINKIQQLIPSYTLSLEEMNKQKDSLWVQMNIFYLLQSHLALSKTEQQRRTTVTPFLNELLSYFNNTITHQNSYKWIMLSAHDTTLQMISAAMNLTSWECIEQYYNGTLLQDSTCLYTYPGYSSNIIFELYQNDQDYYVKLLYNGTAMPMCGTKLTYCNLNTFKNIINAYVVENYDKECGNNTAEAQGKDDQDTSNQNVYPVWVIITMSIIGGCFIVSLVNIFYQWRKIKKLQKEENLSFYSSP